ncbi:hypothetical protein EGW08_009573 [Elysia chlorotica]|uniref:Ig-like domain-containing protein n=1 Tax=Elysia chlorotica TaxID=188477 RepID=A0A433TM64_ELYCH|nr:hypothetical protein EGW08_009573 [Elysia chlorotica]
MGTRLGRGAAWFGGAVLVCLVAIPGNGTRLGRGAAWFGGAVLVCLAAIPGSLAQFNFGPLYDFDLTTDVTFPASGDDVTLRCSRTEQYRRKSSNSFLNEDDVISWELNESPLLTTALAKQGRCQIAQPSDSGILGRPGFRQSRPGRLPNATCSDDGVTIELTLHQWTPSRLAGDTWRCLQFPFAESAKLDLQSLVPVSRVAIKQVIDKGGQYSRSRGTIVTCRTAPCRPRASIDWFAQTPGSGPVRLTSSLGEQVSTTRDELTVTTGAILFSSDLDHGQLVYCTSSNMGERAEQGPVRSDNITVRVKYPPTVSVFSEPSSSIIEGSDVTLHCDATGRPEPKVTWVKADSAADKPKTETGATLVSLSTTLELASVRVTDSGAYTCTATNGLEPNASASLVLYVREAAIPPEEIPEEANSPAEVTSGDGDSSSSGAIAGGVIAALAVLALVAVLIFFMLRHRRKEERFLDRLSAQRSIDSSENQGTYATCSSLPRSSLDQLPPYLELLPPIGSDLKLANVSNPGYGSNDMIISGQKIVPSSHSSHSKRPLPSTPIQPCDTEYDYIDESHVLSAHTPGQTAENAYLKLQAVRTASDGPNLVTSDGDNDGYEIPVKSREAQSLEMRQPVPSARKRVPVRAQTVHTTTPSGRQDGSKPSQTGKGKQDGRRGTSASREGSATRPSSQALERRGSHSYCFNDFNYDTSF